MGGTGLCQHKEPYDVSLSLPIKAPILVASAMYTTFSIGKIAFPFPRSHHDEYTCSLLYECIIHEITLRVSLMPLFFVESPKSVLISYPTGLLLLSKIIDKYM